MFRCLPIIVAVFVLALPGAATAQQPLGSLQRAADPPPETVTNEVIVQFAAGVSANSRSKVRRDADVGAVEAMYRPGQQLLKVQPGQTVSDAIQELERDPQVIYAQPNRIYQAAAVPDDAAFGHLWGLRNLGQTLKGIPGTPGTPGADIGATAAWDRTVGSRSIVVAVADTGIAYDHPDLAANIWTNDDPVNGVDDDHNGFVDDVRGRDFVDNDNDPRDLNAHGTHIAGTIGAVGSNRIGVAGVNWAVSLLPVRVLDAQSSGTSESIANGFNYAAAEGARVVNASLGVSADTDPAMSAAIAAHPDTLFVVAAGNDGQNNDGEFPHVPCNLPAPNLICVAATTQSDGLADFSNVGAISVDLGAPGTNVYSTLTSFNVQDDLEVNLTRWIAQAPWARTGSTSADGAFSVTDSPNGSYANNADTSLRTAAAVPMTGQGCRVAYELRLDSERDFDHLHIETSPNGLTWTERDRWSGSTDREFYALTTNLPTTSTPQFVRFRFTSDGDLVGDGAYLDNLKIGCVDGTYDGTEYGFLEGTSMATPQVVGAAALALALKPSATVAELKNALLTTGDRLPALEGLTVTGRRLNVAALLNAISPPPPPPPTGGGGGGGGGGGTANVPPAPPVVPPRPVEQSPVVETLASVKVGRCRQSKRGSRSVLRCSVSSADALTSASLVVKRGRRTLAKGSARPKHGVLSLSLKRKLRVGKYTVSLLLRDSASHTRKVTHRFRVT